MRIGKIMGRWCLCSLFSSHVCFCDLLSFKHHIFQSTSGQRSAWERSKGLLGIRSMDIEAITGSSSEKSGLGMPVVEISEPLSHPINSSAQRRALHGPLAVKSKVKASFRKWP